MILLFAVAVAAMNPCERVGAQADSTRCAWNDFKRADAALNLQFRRSLADAAEADKEDRDNPAVRGDRGPIAAATLRETERAWLTFRDLNCRVEAYSERGGTIEPMLRNFCLARVTRERTEQLRKMWRRR